MRFTRASALWILGWVSSGQAHDIPDARVDRSIQATLAPSRLRVEYEVSLSELTLIQDLRRLAVEVPGGDPEGWFRQYGEITAPLNAKGFLVEVNGQEVDLRPVGFDLAMETHPRFTFRFEADVPPTGRLSLNDTNYLSSEGTSRLALRPIEGIEVQGDSLPVDAHLIEPRPLWQLSNDEEKRTRRMTVDFARASIASTILKPIPKIPRSPRPASGLSHLLDRAEGQAWPVLLMAAFVLGAAHAIQPGHGKSLVAASTLVPGSGFWRGPLLGLATATAHLGSVALIAAVLWASRSTGPVLIHLILARLAGFAIAAIGLWRLGRHLGGFGEHRSPEHWSGKPFGGFIPLAVAGGIVPCWDAVALVILSEAIGRLALGLSLLVSFSLGMAGVLVLVGMFAGRFRASFDREGRWERGLGLVGGLILAAIGLLMMGNDSLGRWMTP